MAKEETIFDFLPGKYINDFSEDLLLTFQDALDEIKKDVENFTTIVDPDRCPPQFLDLMLQEMGFRVWEGISLTIAKKRKLVKSLIKLYSTKGTKPGIENAVYFFLGIDVNVYYPYRANTWTLGFSELNVQTEVAPTDNSHDYYYTLNVALFETIDTETENLLNKVLEFMVPARFKLNIKQPGESELTYWSLGVSELGLNTVMNN